jgi:PEGA domain
MRTLPLLAVLCLSTPALADDDIGVVVVGEPTMQPQLAAQLEGWLSGHGHQLSPAPLPPEAINTLIDCFVIEDEGCARKVVEKHARSKAVVFARVDLAAGENPERTVTLTAYWFDKGKDALAERRFCERCTEVTLRSTADELMAALTANRVRDAGKLALRSSPPGARVVVDGTPIGVTPLEYDLGPGSHKVTLHGPGDRRVSREVTIRRGETTQLDIRLDAPSALPAILLGVGGALVVGGVVMFALDEDLPGRGQDQPERYRDTAPLGVGAALTGVVVGGLGGYLLLASKRSSTPVATVTSGAGYFGWAGRF